MSTLTNTLISSTYKGVLHTSGTPIPLTGQVNVYDGEGNKSALVVGRDTNGVTVIGTASATSVVAGELTMPNEDTEQKHIVVRTDPNRLELKPLSYVTGGGLTDGEYISPKITVNGGVITQIVSQPIINLLTTPVNIINSDLGPTENGLNTLANSYIQDTYPGPGAAQTFITLPTSVSPSNTLSWSSLTNYNNNYRYALINTKVFVQSNGGDYFVELLLDGKIVSTGEVREHHTNSGVDTMVDSNQQLFTIPQNKISSVLFRIKTLPGSTNVPNEGILGGNKLNIIKLDVTLDGWVY